MHPLVLPIQPGTAPGGLVFRLSTPDGTVLSTETIAADNVDRTDVIASWQGRLAGERVLSGQPTYLHVFDGDTGQCVWMITSRRSGP